ncbi:hypothetical protein THAOC_29564, partial [Thalassiosira oceanica]
GQGGSKNAPQSLSGMPTIAHCCVPGLAMSEVIFIRLRLAPEQATKSPGLPASQLASEQVALVI